MPTAIFTRSLSLPSPAPTSALTSTQQRLAVQSPRLHRAMVACWVMVGVAGLGLGTPAHAADSSAVTVDSSVLDGLGPSLTIPDLMLPPAARPMAPAGMGTTNSAINGGLPSQTLLPDPTSPPKSRMMVPMPGASRSVGAPTLSAPQPRYRAPVPAPTPTPMPYSPPPVAKAPPAPTPAPVSSASAAPTPSPAPAPTQATPTPAPTPAPTAAPAPAKPTAVAVDTNNRPPPQPAPVVAQQAPAVPSTPAAPPATSSPPQQQTAALPPPTVQASGLSLTFGENDTAIPQGANSALDQVVNRLNSDPALRVRVEAYASGGSAGKSRARRLSLSRALAVRSYLLDKGIATERVDVRALGTASSGNADRVDIGWVSG